MNISIDNLLDMKATTTKQTAGYDVLALSVALRRKFPENDPYRFIDFFSAPNVVDVTEEDQNLANLIRDHFKKQILVSLLRDSVMTNFQQALHDFLEANPLEYTDDIQGMIFRLPEMYEHDIAMSDMIHEHFQHSNGDRITGDEIIVVPIKSLKKKLRSKNVVQYWFKMLDKNLPFMLELQHDNPLLNMWDRLFTTRQSMLISGVFIDKQHPAGLEYTTSQKWQIKDL